MAKKILLVDDEPDILALTGLRLRRSGYEVIEAVDAEEALVFLEKNTCDLILLDLLLPNMQGDELCKKLKNDDKFKNIPVILFTASGFLSNLPKKIITLGADDFVTKPFEAAELVGKIKKFIG